MARRLAHLGFAAFLAAVGISACQRNASADADDPATHYANAARLAQNLPVHAMSIATEDAGGAVLEELTETRKQIDAALAAAASGGPSDERIATSWRRVGAALDAIATNAAQVEGARAAQQEVATSVMPFTGMLDEASRLLVDAAGNSRDAAGFAKHVRHVGMLQLIAQRLQRRTEDVLAGSTLSLSAADSVSRDLGFMGRTLAGLRDGDEEIGIGKVEDPKVHAMLVSAGEPFAAIEASARKVLEAAPILLAVGDARETLVLEIADFQGAVDVAQHAAARRSLAR